MTSKEIKAELNKIKYYFSRKEIFDKSFDCLVKNEILETIEKYNEAISHADPRVYEVYIAIYIHNNTHESAASEMNYSLDYVAKYHKLLIKYLVGYFANKMN